MNTTRPRVHHATAHVLLTVAGLTGIAGLFLPFTSNTSPADVLDGDMWGLWPLALPFFLAVPAFAASMRWIISGSLTQPERVVAYVVSAASACATLYFVVVMFSESTGPERVQGWLVWTVPVAILLIGAYVLRRALRAAWSREFSPLVAIQVAFLANAVLCLIGFFGRWQVGAYCSLVTALAYLGQIILICARPGSPGSATAQ